MRADRRSGEGVAGRGLRAPSAPSSAARTRASTGVALRVPGARALRADRRATAASSSRPCAPASRTSRWPRTTSTSNRELLRAVLDELFPEQQGQDLRAHRARPWPAGRSTPMRPRYGPVGRKETEPCNRPSRESSWASAASSPTARAWLTIGHNLTNASTEGYSRQRVRDGDHGAPLRPPAEPRGDARPDRPGRPWSSRIERVQRRAPRGPHRRPAGRPRATGTPGTSTSLMLEQVYNEPSDVLGPRPGWTGSGTPGRSSPCSPQELAAREGRARSAARPSIDGDPRPVPAAFPDFRDMVDGDIRGTRRPGQRPRPPDSRARTRRSSRSKALGDSPNDLLRPPRPPGREARPPGARHHRPAATRTSSWSTSTARSSCRARSPAASR
ncbi:MAG: hypothetical protein M0C28_41535 [Candidatus Moduliflexus flocculans]|nr:hypothetical protein [Candidatus Moduliflexus flocculans]